MPKLYPTHWRIQVKIFERFGCVYVRKKGSHHILTCPEAKRAVVIPEYEEVMWISLKIICEPPG